MAKQKKKIEEMNEEEVDEAVAEKWNENEL